VHLVSEFLFEHLKLDITYSSVQRTSQKGWRMVNSRLCETARRSFFVRARDTFWFLNCKTELLEFSKCEPKTLRGITIRTRDIQFSFGQLKMSPKHIKLRKSFYSLPTFLEVRTLGGFTKRSRSWHGTPGSKNIETPRLFCRKFESLRRKESLTKCEALTNFARPQCLVRPFAIPHIAFPTGLLNLVLLWNAIITIFVFFDPLESFIYYISIPFLFTGIWAQIKLKTSQRIHSPLLLVCSTCMFDATDNKICWSVCGVFKIWHVCLTPSGELTTKFSTARLRPEVQPLTLLYIIFHRKGTVSYTFHWKMVPLSHTYLRALHPFSKPLECS